MKREINFRGKRIDNGEWIYGFLDYRDTSFEIHVVEDIPPTIKDPCGDQYDEYFRVYPESIGQYTNNEDRNGTKIYDSMILNISSEKFLVFWDDNKCCWGLINKYNKYQLRKDIENIQIIGNIYENPGLLENI